LKEYEIGSEEQAFALLQKALRNELGDKPFTLKFDNWPVLSISLDGEGYDSTITSAMAEAVVEVQRAVNRTYSRLTHGRAHSGSLTDSERQDIQFKAKVKKGSSVIEINLGEFAEKLVIAIGDKVTPEMLAVTVIGVAITGASFLAYKAFLKSRSDDKQIEQTERTKLLMSKEETRRLEVMAQATQRAPVIAQVRQDFDEARNEIVRSVGDADNISVNDLPIENQTARAIATARRSTSVETQLNGNYLIKGVDLRQEGQVRLRVASQADGREFIASFEDQSLRRGQITILQNAEWERLPVYLSINARLLRGEVTTATVVSVKQQPITEE
jgi:hypothetical protein